MEQTALAACVCVCVRENALTSHYKCFLRAAHVSPLPLPPQFSPVDDGDVCRKPSENWELGIQKAPGAI